MESFLDRCAIVILIGFTVVTAIGLGWILFEAWRLQHYGVLVGAALLALLIWAGKRLDRRILK